MHFLEVSHINYLFARFFAPCRGAMATPVKSALLFPSSVAGCLIVVALRLLFPLLPTIQAPDKDRHRLICRSRLQLIV